MVTPILDNSKNRHFNKSNSNDNDNNNNNNN